MTEQDDDCVRRWMKEDWVIFFIFMAVLAIFLFYMHFQLWTIILAVIVIILLLYFLGRNVCPEEGKKKRIVGTYVGWMVTWMPNFQVYGAVRGENAMRLAYGRADIYSDGYIESLPDSFRMTYYMGDSEMPRRFNPFYDGWMLKEYARKQGKEVPYADGTGIYISQNLMGVREGYLKPPKGLKKLPKTQSW